MAINIIFVEQVLRHTLVGEALQVEFQYREVHSPPALQKPSKMMTILKTTTAVALFS